jgi:hypothetical protein
VRRIRSQEPGAAILFEATRGSRAKSGVRIESDVQIALDTDARKLIDAIRLGLGDALRGRSTPALERTWHLTPITGSPVVASTVIELTSAGGAAYLGRIFSGTVASVVPKLTAEWLNVAAPKSGDGVGTPASPTLGGGPLPLNPKR